MNPSFVPQPRPPETGRWRVELFGGVRARRLDVDAGDWPVVDSFRTQKTGALLAFLALDRRLHSREWLAELMWPELSIEAARNNLRVSLSWLRSALGDKSGRVLRATREAIGAGEALSSDLDEFRVQLKRAESIPDEQARLHDLEEVLQLATAPPLRGIYDDWAISAARRFEGEFLEAARRVMAARETRREWLLALDCARHAAMIVPESDSAMRDVVRLGLRAGESASVKLEFEAWKMRRERSGLSNSPAWKELTGNFEALAAVETPNKQERAPGAPTIERLTSVQQVAHSFAPRSLPSLASSFVGRKREREEIGALLHSRDVRLVTILGAGGAGKTRLALEIARAAHEEEGFEAVAWVATTALGTPRAVHNALFDALGIGGEALDFSSLQNALLQLPRRTKAARVLLVLDNFEHLGKAGASWLQQLLGCCDQLVVLVTSRVALQVAGEQLWILGPLPFEGGASPSITAGATQNWPDAVRLFVQRASLVRPDFSPSPSDVEDIARICGALDGSPLAIEVAAARLALFSPSQLALELFDARAHRFGAAPRLSKLPLEEVEEPIAPTSLLDWPNRDVNAPARHRTLREAIEWSARQLPPPARAFWARASTFRGAFSVEAAREICEEPGAATLISSLRDSSLLTVHTEGAPARASWNDALREFAQGLLQGQERAHLEARHAAYFARVARELGTLSRRGEGDRAFAGFGADGAPPSSDAARERAGRLARAAREELDLARADLRAAFEWFLARDVESALRMGAHLWPSWAANKRLAEGRALLERALGAPPQLAETAPSGEARASWIRSWQVRAEALEGAGALAALGFDPRAARGWFEAARVAFERAGNAEGVARALDGAGLAALQGGDLTAARSLSEQSLSLENSSQNAARRGALFNLSLVAIMSGDFASVRALASEGLALHRAQNDRHGIALCLESLGQVALFEGEIPTARVYFCAARDGFEALSEEAGLARAMWGLGHVERKVGDFLAARAHFELSFGISGASEHSWALPYLLEAFALLAPEEGDIARALRLLVATRRVRREAAMPLPRPFFADELEHLESRCRTELGSARFEAEHIVTETLSHVDLVALIRME